MSRWIPASVFIVGAILVFGASTSQRVMYLRAPLDEAVPRVIEGVEGRDLEISEAEQRVAGMDRFVLREYAGPDIAPFSVYVGYYRDQAQGTTIHSPKNCLPGGGWEPLTSGRIMIPAGTGAVEVNRYLIGNDQARALVLYWYQGRGRVAASEYAVKWHLLRDKALHGRSDEALVRVIVPVDENGEAAAEQRAVDVAQAIVPAVNRALPM